MYALNQKHEAHIKFQQFCLAYRQSMNEDFPYHLDKII